MRTNQTDVAAVGTQTTVRAAVFKGWHRGAGATFKLMWAQNTSGASNTKVLTGSVIRYRVIS